MLSLFSNHVPTSEKQKMVRSLMANKNDDPNNSQLMPFAKIFKANRSRISLEKTVGQYLTC